MRCYHLEGRTYHRYGVSKAKWVGLFWGAMYFMGGSEHIWVWERKVKNCCFCLSKSPTLSSANTSFFLSLMVLWAHVSYPVFHVAIHVTDLESFNAVCWSKMAHSEADANYSLWRGRQQEFHSTQFFYKVSHSLIMRWPDFKRKEPPGDQIEADSLLRNKF